MKKSQMVVRAFDGTKKGVLENIELPIQVGPCTFNLEFIVMDINPSYNCLLRRPWIHMTSAIPSTLHQKVKFLANEDLITVVIEKDMVAAPTISTLTLKLRNMLLSVLSGHLRLPLPPMQRMDLKCQLFIYRKTLR